MLTNKISNLFNQYLLAFKQYDLNNVMACYNLPCTLNTPDKLVLLQNSKNGQQEFTDIFTQLQQEKMRDIIVRKASYSSITDTLLLVSIDWEFIDDNNEIFADFCALYHLIIVDDGLKIINVASHDLSNSLTLAHSFSLKS